MGKVISMAGHKACKGLKESLSKLSISANKLLMSYEALTSMPCRYVRKAGNEVYECSDNPNFKVGTIHSYKGNGEWVKL